MAQPETAQPLRIVIGADDAGFDYKEILKKDLLANPGVAEVIDVGVDADGHTPYPKVAIEAAQQVAAGTADRALLICGTGLGVAIAARVAASAAVRHASVRPAPASTAPVRVVLNGTSASTRVLSPTSALP